MKRICCFILGFLLLFPALALGEYEQYRLTEPDKSGTYRREIFPMDVHNVIVRVIAPDDGWHTDWYHDGELTGRLVSQGDWDRLTTVEPVFLTGGALLALCRIESDADADKAYLRRAGETGSSSLRRTSISGSASTERTPWFRPNRRNMSRGAAWSPWRTRSSW